MFSDREDYTRALYWLISHDLVIQAHAHVKVLATRETKARARKELEQERLLKRLSRETNTKRRGSLPETHLGERPHLLDLALQAEQGDSSDSFHPPTPTGNPIVDESLNLSEEDFDEDKLGEEFLNDLRESFIHRPKKPSSAENRCLKIIMQDKEKVWQRRFAQYVPIVRDWFELRMMY